MKKFLALLLTVVLAMAAAVPALAEQTYPLDTDTVLDVWFAEIAYSSSYKSAAEAPLFKALSEQTGVTVNWIEPAAGSDTATAYNLMMMSGEDLPDIIWSADICNNAAIYLDDGVIVDLTEYMNEEYAPNLMALYEANPALASNYMTDDGRVYGFPSINEATSWYGPWIRSDWLAECELDVPETIDDWTEMLTAFKEKYNAQFSCIANFQTLFLGSYGLINYTQNNGFILDDGQVVYCYETENYREFLTQMNEWYAAGLLDPDWLSNDQTTLIAKCADNQVGAIGAFQVTGAGIGAALAPSGADNPWIPVGYPKKSADSERSLVCSGLDALSMASAITTECEDVETAVRFLDFLYSDAGMTLINFGIEGESFEYGENGNPQYTDTFLHGPEGMVEYARRYTAIVGNCPGVKTAAAGNARNDAASNEAEATWKGDWTNAEWAEYLMPILSPTEEETDAITDKLSALTTNVSENMYNFIIGERSLDEFDAYVDELYSRYSLEEVKAIRQAQVDRVLSR